jgi:hypothetical protein
MGNICNIVNKINEIVKIENEAINILYEFCEFAKLELPNLEIMNIIHLKITKKYCLKWVLTMTNLCSTKWLKVESNGIIYLGVIKTHPLYRKQLSNNIKYLDMARGMRID